MSSRQFRVRGEARSGVLIVPVLALTLLLPIACSSPPEPTATDEDATASDSMSDEARPMEPGDMMSPAAQPEDPRIPGLRAQVEADPGNARARHALGRALVESKMPHEAVEHFEKAAEIEPNVPYLFDLAVAYTRVSKLNEAAATYRRVLIEVPNDPQALHNLGNVMLNKGNKDEAIDLMWQAIRAKPDFLLARYELANIYKFYGQHEEAYGIYQSVLRGTPRDRRDQDLQVDSLYQISAIDVARGAYAEAEVSLARLLQIMPDHGSAHYARGQALMHLGRVDEAQQEFAVHQQILEAAPVDGPMAIGR